MPRDEATVLDLINAAKLALKSVEVYTRDSFGRM